MRATGYYKLSIDQRLIYKRIDHLPVLPADAARRLRHPHHDEFLARVDPPVGAAGARPREVANRAHHAYDAWRRAHRDAEAKAVVGARGVARHSDHVAYVGRELVRGHELDGLSTEHARIVERALVRQHGGKTEIVAGGRGGAAAAAFELLRLDQGPHRLLA